MKRFIAFALLSPLSTISFAQTPLTSDNFNNYAPSLTGAGASGSWNINVSNSARLGTLSADFSQYGGNLGWLAGLNATNSHIMPYKAADVKNFLGIPANGETLQSVADRGNFSDKIIYITGENIGLTPTAGRAMNFRQFNSGAGAIDCYDHTNNVGVALSINNSGGNVGIGTTSPAYKLHVLGQTVASKAFVSQGMNDSWVGAGAYMGYNIEDGAGRIGAFDYDYSSWRNLILNEGGGNIGIGTAAPAYKLDVNGSGRFMRELLIQTDLASANVVNISNSNQLLSLGVNNYDGGAFVFVNSNHAFRVGTNNTERMRISPDGNVGIGTTDISNAQGWQRVVDIHGDVNAKMLVTSNSVKTGIFSHNIWGAAAGRIGTESAHPLYLMAGYGNDVVAVLPGGSVGIGTKDPGSYKLAVEGVVGARKIKVTQESWADYVFDSSYQLAPLSHVETFIKENKHLPEVPSAAEVKKDGLDLGDNQAVLLKKIEELTLYIIQQNKELVDVKKRLSEIETRH